MIASVPGSLPPLSCGLLGGTLTFFIGTLPLPSFILSPLVSFFERLVVEKQPELLSGATLSVQRQQQVDLLEGIMMTLQQRRQVRNPLIIIIVIIIIIITIIQQTQRPVDGYIPTEDQVRLLVGMGFRSDESRAALVTSNGQIHQAIHLLTTSQQQYQRL